MKYFKHYNTAHSSTSMNLIIDKLGLAGYAQYFILMELCSAKWDLMEPGYEQCRFRFHRKHLALNLRTKSFQIGIILTSFQECGQLSWLQCDNEVIIEIPKLLDSLDKHSKYRRSVVASRSRKATLELEQELEQELEGIKGKSTPPSGFLKSTKSGEAIIEMIPIISYEKWCVKYSKDYVDSEIKKAIEYYSAEPGYEFWNTMAWVRKINAWLSRGFGKKKVTTLTAAEIEMIGFEPEGTHDTTVLVSADRKT